MTVLSRIGHIVPTTDVKKDKSRNTSAFNKKWKDRRAKAKHDAKNRKKNRRK